MRQKHEQTESQIIHAAVVHPAGRPRKGRVGPAGGGLSPDSGKEGFLVVHEVGFPAVFMNPRLTDLVHYQGEAPWTGGALTKSQPGWPNEGRQIPESWAAYVNKDGIGAGVFVPIAQSITCYRFGATPEAVSACSYFAPIVKFAITPGLDFSYEAALAIGRPEDMRTTFAGLRSRLLTPALPGAKP